MFSRLAVQPEAVPTSLPEPGFRARCRCLPPGGGRGERTLFFAGRGVGAGGFGDSNARVFSGDVGRPGLQSARMLVCTRPRGLSQFAHMGPLQSTVSRGARGAASAVSPAAGSVS